MSESSLVTVRTDYPVELLRFNTDGSHLLAYDGSLLVDINLDNHSSKKVSLESIFPRKSPTVRDSYRILPIGFDASVGGIVVVKTDGNLGVVDPNDPQRASIVAINTTNNENPVWDINSAVYNPDSRRVYITDRTGIWSVDLTTGHARMLHMASNISCSDVDPGIGVVFCSEFDRSDYNRSAPRKLLVLNTGSGELTVIRSGIEYYSMSVDTEKHRVYVYTVDEKNRSAFQTFDFVDSQIRHIKEINIGQVLYPVVIDHRNGLAFGDRDLESDWLTFGSEVVMINIESQQTLRIMKHDPFYNGVMAVDPVNRRVAVTHRHGVFVCTYDPMRMSDGIC